MILMQGEAVSQGSKYIFNPTGMQEPRTQHRTFGFLAAVPGEGNGTPPEEPGRLQSVGSLRVGHD